MSKPSLAIAYSMSKKKKRMASGGTVKSGNPTMDYAKGGCVCGSPMCKGGCAMSKGGEVANDTGMGASADEESNEFDYLVKSGGLSAEQPMDSNEKGDPDGEDYKKDLVSRAMLKRKKR